MIIHKFVKSTLEEIRIEICEYQGKEYLNIRIWYDASKGQNTDWKPTQKGITLPINLLQELKVGIDKAIKERNEN